MTSDLELFATAMAGGSEAFAPIVQRYQDAVFGVALARLQDFHAAEDVAQDVFVTAFRELGNLKDPSRLGAWLRTMTIRDCIDYQRRRRERPDAGGLETRRSDATEPHAELQRRELREAVLAAIGRLSKTQRETTTLFYVNGYSVAEVAGIQDVPVGTVKGRLHDAREKLKEEIIGMVENVLKSEAPKEDFGQRVLELLERTAQCPLGQWDDVIVDLRAIGARGLEGYLKAFESPHWRLRSLAVNAILSCEAEENREAIVQLLKRALRDPNRRIRRMAFGVGLNALAISDDRKRKELVPLVVPLLFDPAKRVRRLAAWELKHNWAADVPLEKAVRAMLDERDPVTREWKEHLVRAVLAARSLGAPPAPDKTSPEQIDTLLASLSDSNSAVRANAARMLLELPIDRRRKSEQILPAVVELLSDPAKRVRSRLAEELYPWAAEVPADKVEKAYRAEPDPRIRKVLGKLLRKAAQMQSRDG